jgi:hypothetical protein
MQNTVVLSRDAFQKNPDGSWTCISNTDNKHGGNIIRVKPGTTFRKSHFQWGLDVPEILNREDSQLTS